MENWYSAHDAAAWGTVAYADLLPYMDARAQSLAATRCPNPAGVYVAAFPYWAGEQAGNLSVYARGEDYHRVVLRRLEAACASLRVAHPGNQFVPGVDSSPLPEHAAAGLAGIGLGGLHTLTILPPYGSYVFLGTVLTDLPLERASAPAPNCIGCGKCAEACPSGALSLAGVDVSKCLSHITQKKGTLSEGETALLRAHPAIWGCDLCQQACPYNRDAQPTSIPEFSADLICSLESADLSGLANRQFVEKYGLHAFAWRGPSVLRRNLDVWEQARK